MKKLSYIVSIYFLIFTCYAQKKVAVKNKITNEKIPYLTFWAKNNPISFTSDHKGKIQIDSKNDIELFTKSTIYKDYKIMSSKLPKIIYLEPKENMNNNVILKKIESEKIKTNDSLTLEANFTNQIVAKWFKNESHRKIKKIKFFIKPVTNKTLFKINFFNCDSLQKPLNHFFNKEIIVETTGEIDFKVNDFNDKILKEYIEIDLDIESHNVITPNDNFYVGIESLQILNNQLKSKTDSSENQLKDIISLSLSPYLVFNRTNQHDTVKFINGYWINKKKSLAITIEYLD